MRVFRVGVLILVLCIGVGCAPGHRTTESGRPLPELFGLVFDSLNASQSTYLTYTNIAQSMRDTGTMTEETYGRVRELASLHKALNDALVHALRDWYEALETGAFPEGELEALRRALLDFSAQLPGLLNSVSTLMEIPLPADILTRAEAIAVVNKMEGTYGHRHRTR